MRYSSSTVGMLSAKFRARSRRPTLPQLHRRLHGTYLSRRPHYYAGSRRRAATSHRVQHGPAPNVCAEIGASGAAPWPQASLGPGIYRPLLLGGAKIREKDLKDCLGASGPSWWQNAKSIAFVLGKSSYIYQK